MGWVNGWARYMDGVEAWMDGGGGWVEAMDGMGWLHEWKLPVAPFRILKGNTKVMFTAYFLRVLGRFHLVARDRSEELCLMVSYGDSE